MSRAISRDSFNELKQYIGVHLQQGRVILDSDWNEGQDIMATLARRLGQDTFGDGVLGEGFEIQPVIPSPWKPSSLALFTRSYSEGYLPVSMRFPPTAPFDTFESMDGWTLEGGTGNLRISRDRPYEGRGFLRLSDHTGEVTLARTLSSPTDLSAYQYGHFRFRLNHDASVPNGVAKFFIEDTNGHRSLWPLTAPWAAKDRWFPGAALPLDLGFHLFDLEPLPAIQGRQYKSPLITYPSTSNAVSFSITGNRPPGLDVEQSQISPSYGMITGTPTQAGTFTFTVNATSGGKTVAREFTVTVLEDPARTPLNAQLLDLKGTAEDALGLWRIIHARPTTTNGTAANLFSIKRYGFIIASSGAAPTVWDFDALYFSSRSHVHKKARNDFVIGGPLANQVVEDFFNFARLGDLPEGQNGNEATEIEKLLGGTPRAFVGGYTCGQQREILYSDQRHPDDPPNIKPPAQPGSPSQRTDLVYLDVTREPVTYIEDPDLREIALGGPDTSTRMKIRQRIRVATDGSLPTESGIGGGRLSTEGTYTDRSNRLYLIEVDTAGDIGTATVRWSDDNGSTLQRVIEPVLPRSTKIKVEDASAFRTGDFILLRKEFVSEEHRIASVAGNTIILQEGTSNSTTFTLTDRPSVQRWNAFHVPVIRDSNDSTISAPVNLSHGIAVRFGGRSLKRGDSWTFRARHLMGSASEGIDQAARVEALDFQPPQGVVHHYAPLALIVRDSALYLPDHVQLIRDIRRRAGKIVFHQQSVSFETGPVITNITKESDFLFIGSADAQSSFLLLWSGLVHGKPSVSTEGKLTITVDLFDRNLAPIPLGEPNFQTVMQLFYDDTPRPQSAFSIILPTLGREVAAVRASYTTTRVHEAPQPLTTTLDGTLAVIEVRGSLNDLTTLPFTFF